MTSEQTCLVQAHQKSDGNWYYVLVIDGETGAVSGPHDTEEDARTAGERELRELGMLEDE